MLQVTKARIKACIQGYITSYNVSEKNHYDCGVIELGTASELYLIERFSYVDLRQQ